MQCCHPDTRTSTVIPNRAALRDLTAAHDAASPKSLHGKRSETQLFNELIRGRRRHERVTFRLILYHTSHRADANKVIGHHLSWNAEKEDQVHKLFGRAESNARGAPPDPQGNTVDEIGPRMRKSNSLACIGRTSSFSFHDSIGKLVEILHVSVVPQQFRYFQDSFRRGALAQFQDDQCGIKNFGEECGHLRIAERLIGLTG